MSINIQISKNITKKLLKKGKNIFEPLEKNVKHRIQCNFQSPWLIQCLLNTYELVRSERPTFSGRKRHFNLGVNGYLGNNPTNVGDRA